jgi:lipopolysaccharide/colanic/teichoic acid biosynthesis glycosyltransferase
MVKQLKGMSDTQLNMMVKATATIQKGAQAVKKAKDVVLSRAFLILAVLVLLLAFLLRYFGIM